MSLTCARARVYFLELNFSSSAGSSGLGPGVPVRPAAVRMVTVSRIPRAAVAASGIVYGLWKPDAEAWGADAAPIRPPSDGPPGTRARL